VCEHQHEDWHGSIKSQRGENAIFELTLSD